MKLLVFFSFSLLSIHSFACKMSPEAYRNRSGSVAKDFVVKNYAKGRDISKTDFKDGIWSIDVSKKGKCQRYLLKIKMPGGSCAMNAELLSQKDCSI